MFKVMGGVSVMFKVMGVGVRGASHIQGDGRGVPIMFKVMGAGVRHREGRQSCSR